MSYWLYYREDGYYNGEHYCGWGDFECSVCKRDVFIQYDAHEKPSTGELIEWKGKCYCLCNKCVSKCMNVGKAKLLQDARSYEPHEPKEEEPEWMKELSPEYKGVASMLPLVAMFAAVTVEVQKIKKLPKEQQKKARKELIKSLRDKMESEKSMKKMTIIDGMNVIVTTCGDCPFYDGGDDGWNNQCKYPKHNIELENYCYDDMDKNCPLKDYDSE